MPKLAKELSALAVKNLNSPGVWFVGGVPGLALQVKNSGTRSWIYRVVIGGRRRDMGIGPYPAVGVAEARKKAIEARNLVRQGVDPIQQQQAALSALRAKSASSRTFKEAAREYIAAHEASWRNSKSNTAWTNTLATYAQPVIGDLLVADITKAHVLEILKPIWYTKTETASRLRGRMELVLSYAMQAGYMPEGLNPARWRGNLDQLLPKKSQIHEVQHYGSLRYQDGYQFLQRLAGVEGMGAKALEFAILTGTRTSEVRGAPWDEFDIDAGVWNIPAVRMKGKIPHQIPLSGRALAILKIQRAIDGDFVFPGRNGKKMSDGTMRKALRSLGYTKEQVHGFRTTLRVWAAEKTSYPFEVAEMALAHVIRDSAQKAYQRSNLLDTRRAMMEDWATYLSTEPGVATVHPISAKVKKP